MDRLFQSPIICAYIAWREAKQRGSWFLLLIITTIFVVMMSLHGCALHENIPGFEPTYYPPLLTQERLAYLDAHRSDGWPPGRPQLGYPANKLVAHTVNRTNPYIEKLGITVSSGTRQWNACSIYDGIEQSHWEQLTQPTREQKVFADVYRRFAVA